MREMYSGKEKQFRILTDWQEVVSYLQSGANCGQFPQKLSDILCKHLTCSSTSAALQAEAVKQWNWSFQKCSLLLLKPLFFHLSSTISHTGLWFTWVCAVEPHRTTGSTSSCVSAGTIPGWSCQTTSSPTPLLSTPKCSSVSGSLTCSSLTRRVLTFMTSRRKTSFSSSSAMEMS